jgi:hypothetical protein
MDVSVCTSSPPRNRKRKPRKDDGKAVFELADAEATRAEEAAMREAIAKSLADLVPVENTMPMDAALALVQAGLGKGAGGAAAAAARPGASAAPHRSRRSSGQMCAGHQAGRFQ